jgi:uracil-DNA glycosylase family 4
MAGSAGQAAEEALAQVAAEVRICTKCDLHKGTKNGVPGDGSPHAEVMFIGEAPGYREDQQGKPFVGPAGQFLNELLASVGLDRSSVFITNVVKHRPPENRDPLPEEIAACSGYLDRQIAAINPKVIVTLGRYSMAKFFPGAKISAIHGQAKRIGGRIVVAMYHPAAALHQQSLRQTLVDDFQRAIPAALAEAAKMAPPPKKQEQDEEKPPEQLSLF